MYVLLHQVHVTYGSMRIGTETMETTNGVAAVGKRHHNRVTGIARAIGATRLRDTDGMKAAGTNKKLFSCFTD